MMVSNRSKAANFSFIVCMIAKVRLPSRAWGETSFLQQAFCGCRCKCWERMRMGRRWRQIRMMFLWAKPASSPSPPPSAKLHRIDLKCQDCWAADAFPWKSPGAEPSTSHGRGPGEDRARMRFGLFI
jgi:hypothetical protein